jgi:hypothetical protein
VFDVQISVGVAHARGSLEPLMDAGTIEEKMAVLDTLATYMKENNLIAPNPEIDALQRIANATNLKGRSASEVFEEIKAAAHQASGIPTNESSSWFGR